jgi:hypothetical protein
LLNKPAIEALQQWYEWAKSTVNGIYSIGRVAFICRQCNAIGKHWIHRLLTFSLNELQLGLWRIQPWLPLMIWLRNHPYPGPGFSVEGSGRLQTKIARRSSAMQDHHNNIVFLIKLCVNILSDPSSTFPPFSDWLVQSESA